MVAHKVWEWKQGNGVAAPLRQPGAIGDPWILALRLTQNPGNRRVGLRAFISGVPAAGGVVVYTW